MDPEHQRDPHTTATPPGTCRIESACVITLRDMDSPEDFLDTCHHVNLLAKQGYDRIVVDLSGVRKIYSPFLVYLAGFLRKQAHKGCKVIVAGSTKAIKVFLRKTDAGGGPPPGV